MPLHDLLCQNEDCNAEVLNVYIEMDKIDDPLDACEKCGGEMYFDHRRKLRRSTRGIKFKEFTLHHTRRLDGSPEGREIHSLADIRQFEKDHEDQQVCVEAFSYDTEQHVPEPVSKDEPVRMTEQQKRDFAEKFRDLNIKDETSARDY